MTEENYKLNSTVVPTWKHLKLNNFNLNNFIKPVIENYKKSYLEFSKEDFKGTVVIPMEQAIKVDKNACTHSNLEEKFGVSHEFVKIAESEFNSGVFVHLPKDKIINSYIKMNFVLDKENPIVVDHNIILAEPGSKVTLIVDYSSDNAAEIFHNGVTKVFAGENSEVNIIKVQRMNNNAVHLDSNLAVVSRDAKVNWITIEIGSDTNVTNYMSSLDEEGSKADIFSAYFVDGERRQDLYYTANHKGKRSQSNMVIKGVLKDHSKKVFRGNIDFKKGSSKSKGAQEENVLLLSPNVKTDSVPMLLCQEEDVDGAHAASVGKIDEEKLFYLMSRGFSEHDAKKLVIEAEFSPIFDKVPDENLKELLGAEIKRRLSNG
ncbi:MAG: sufD [Clostridiaceae bacterium]|jgi:FeS assembly protein SufD|nr:sufD [Clostridiaceae bacterium]